LTSETIPNQFAHDNPYLCFTFWYRTTGTSIDLRVIDDNVDLGPEESWRAPNTASN